MSSREWIRKAVHLGLGAGAFLLPTIGVDAMIRLCAAAVAFNLFLLPRFARVLLREGGDSGHRGLVLYPAVLLGLLLVFRSDPRPAQAGWISLAVGDAIAGLIADRSGGPRWPLNRRKRVFASVLGQLVAALALLFLVAPSAALAAALGGSVGDGCPEIMDDNLSIPVLAALASSLVLEPSPWG